MAIIKHIKQGGHIESLHLKGSNRNLDRGILFNHPPNEVIQINALRIENCFVPITVADGCGLILIKQIFNKNYGGDLIDDWCGGVLFVDELKSRNNTPTRPYNQYHQDIYQADKLKTIVKNGRKRKVSNPNAHHQGAVIRNIDVIVKGKNAQGFVFTGACKNSGSDFGRKRFNVKLGGYPHLVNGYQLQNAHFGGENNKVNADIYIKNRYRKNQHTTKDVSIQNLPINNYCDDGVHLC